MNRLVSLLVFVLIANLKVSTAQINCSEPFPDPNLSPASCCNLPEIISPEDLQACYSAGSDVFSYFRPGDTPWLRNLCIYDCVFNRTNLMIGGSVNPRAIEDRLFRVNSNPEWLAPIQASTRSCFSEPSTAMQAKIEETLVRHMEASRGNPDTCFSVGGIVVDCIFLELFKRCPASATLSSTPGCQSLHEYVNNCGKW